MPKNNKSIVLKYHYPCTGPEDLTTLYVTIYYTFPDKDLLDEINTYKTVRSIEK